MSILHRQNKRPCVVIYLDCLRSPEFGSLTPRAQILWIRLRGQFNPNNPDCWNKATDQPQVKFSYSELLKIKGFHSKLTISETFKELVAKGWLVLTERGGKGGALSAYSFAGKFANFPKSRLNNKK